MLTFTALYKFAYYYYKPDLFFAFPLPNRHNTSGDINVRDGRELKTLGSSLVRVLCKNGFDSVRVLETTYCEIRDEIQQHSLQE